MGLIGIMVYRLNRVIVNGGTCLVLSLLMACTSLSQVKPISGEKPVSPLVHSEDLPRPPLQDAAIEKEIIEVDEELEASKPVEGEFEADPKDLKKDQVQAGTSGVPKLSEPIVDGPKIPAEMNDRVIKWIHYFTEKDRERFQKFIDRGHSYRSVIEDILEENEIPKDLYYLAMIESGFVPHATSRARAVGVWQFMKPTGKLFGLKSDLYVDERRDPIRATEAAARYLRYLYREFNSWYLALSAYNAGEGRIRKAIRRGRTRDFWALARKRVLPRETKDYVPKFLAAMVIGHNPTKYGFQVNDSAPYPDVELVEVPSPIKLSDLATQCGLKVEDLEMVNPHLIHGVTPPGKGRFEVWIPAESVSQVMASAEKVALMNAEELKPIQAKAEKNEGAMTTHRVRSGESLGSIARRYHLSVSYLKRLNSLSSDRIKPGLKLRVHAKAYKKRSKRG